MGPIWKFLEINNQLLSQSMHQHGKPIGNPFCAPANPSWHPMGNAGNPDRAPTGARPGVLVGKTKEAVPDTPCFPE